MSGDVGVGGAWKDFVSGGSHVGVGGAWKKIAKAWIGVAGAWKEWYTAEVVTVSGETITDSNAGASSRAAVRFKSDGNVERILSGSPAQIDAATDWLRPASAAPGLYEIKAHVDSGGPLDGSSSAVDTWLALTSNREWGVTDLNASAASFVSAQLTIEIRLNGGPVLESGVYNLEANRDTS